MQFRQWLVYKGLSEARTEKYLMHLRATYTTIGRMCLEQVDTKHS